MPLKGPIARGTVRTSMVLGLRLMVQAGTLLLVARFLGPDQFGGFAAVAALAVMLGTLATFGTHLVLLGETSKEPGRREQVLSYAVPSTLACGGILLAIYIVICRFALHETQVPATALIAIGVTETLLQPLLTLPAMEHLALGNIARSQILQTLPLALRLGIAATVFLAHPSEPLVPYGYGYFAASAIALAIATIDMPAAWPRPRAWRLPTRDELRETSGFAVLSITATTPAELDKTLAAKLLPLYSAGLYSAGARVVGAATLPVIAMLLSALPRLFREGHENSHRTTHLLRWIFAAAFAYSLALSAALWVTAPAFAWLFGAKYDGIQHVVRWFCLAVPGMTLRMSAGSILMAVGKPWMRIGFEVTGLIILVISSAVFTRNFGTIGMPLALACSEWGMACMGAALFLHEYRKPKKSVRADNSTTHKSH